MSGSFAPPSTSGSSSPNAISFSNADRTITSGECTGANLVVRQTGTISAARTLTLPAANAVSAGYRIDVTDETGSVGFWFPINITRAGSDTINGSSQAIKLEIPYQTISLVSNGSNAWTVVNSSFGSRDAQLLFDDFYTPLSVPFAVGNFSLGQHNFALVGSAGGTQLRASNGQSTDFYGAIQFVVNNSAGAFGGIYTFNQFSYSTFSVKQTYRLKLDDFSSYWSGGTLAFNCGLGVTPTNSEPATGVYFLIDGSVNSTNWLCCTANGGTRTRTNSSTAFAVNRSIIELGIEADASSAKFYINGSLVATNTTNLPASNVSLCLAHAANRSITTPGNATALVEIDWVKTYYRPNTAR